MIFCQFSNGGCQLQLQFSQPFCINFQNLRAHHQEEILRFLKHPQKSSFWWVLAEKTAKNKVATKIEYQKYFRKNLSSLEHHNLASDSSNWASRGCFGNLRTSSWWWPQRFWRLMHPRRFKACILILKKYGANCSLVPGPPTINNFTPLSSQLLCLDWVFDCRGRVGRHLLFYFTTFQNLSHTLSYILTIALV